MADVYSFHGCATKHGLKCADGRTISKSAFVADNGKIVPLVWNHQHDDPHNVLGHALLEYRDDGVYAHLAFNDTETGKTAKTLVEHGDVSSLSIFANQLKQQAATVIHGVIREVSLVLSGANPGALIDMALSHSEDGSDEDVSEARIYTGEEIVLEHSNPVGIQVTEPVGHNDPVGEPGSIGATGPNDDASLQHAEEETIEDIYNGMSDKQKIVVIALIEQALEDADKEPATDESDESVADSEGISETPTDESVQHNDEEEPIMKFNVFDSSTKETKENTLSHSDTAPIFAEARSRGASLKEITLAHGITDISYLYPDATQLNTTPGLITRDMTWVDKVMNGVHRTPFSRVKSLFANLTADEARAKGYIKGHLKIEQVMTMLRRSTDPTTVYKKQKLDRDDIIDITDFDVVGFLKTEMRFMLDEEIARAILISDGRSGSAEDKINETHIRPIWTDEDLFTVKEAIVVASIATATDDAKAKAVIRAAVKSRKNYKGSGNPTMFTTEDLLADMLLMEDKNERRMYANVSDLATSMLVKEIVTVPVMEGLTRTNSAQQDVTLKAIIVNLNDYNLGADRGGAVNLFDDFDIDFNQQKYLIETRCSGALVKPYSAIVLEMVNS